MDAAEALARLEEVAPQLRAAAIVGDDGGVLASTAADADAFAAAAGELLDAAASLRPGRERSVERLYVVTEAGSVFAVSDNGRTIAAVGPADAVPEPVLHDLRRCLSSLEEEPADASA